MTHNFMEFTTWWGDKATGESRIQPSVWAVKADRLKHHLQALPKSIRNRILRLFSQSLTIRFIYSCQHFEGVHCLACIYEPAL